MPGMNSTGPNGSGPMTGRGRGACGSAGGAGCGMGFGRGFGGPRGASRGVGPGRGLGWFSVGNNGVGNDDAKYSDDIHSALEARSAYLRAELTRTEALLAASAQRRTEGIKEPGEDSGT